MGSKQTRFNRFLKRLNKQQYNSNYYFVKRANIRRHDKNYVNGFGPQPPGWIMDCSAHCRLEHWARKPQKKQKIRYHQIDRWLT